MAVERSIRRPAALLAAALCALAAVAASAMELQRDGLASTAACRRWERARERACGSYSSSCSEQRRHPCCARVPPAPLRCLTHLRVNITVLPPIVLNTSHIPESSTTLEALSHHDPSVAKVQELLRNAIMEDRAEVMKEKQREREWTQRRAVEAEQQPTPPPHATPNLNDVCVLQSAASETCPTNFRSGGIVGFTVASALVERLHFVMDEFEETNALPVPTGYRWVRAFVCCGNYDALLESFGAVPAWTFADACPDASGVNDISAGLLFPRRNFTRKPFEVDHDPLSPANRYDKDTHYAFIHPRLCRVSSSAVLRDPHRVCFMGSSCDTAGLVERGQVIMRLRVEPGSHLIVASEVNGTQLFDPQAAAAPADDTSGQDQQQQQQDDPAAHTAFVYDLYGRRSPADVSWQHVAVRMCCTH